SRTACCTLIRRVKKTHRRIDSERNRCVSSWVGAAGKRRERPSAGIDGVSEHVVAVTTGAVGKANRGATHREHNTRVLDESMPIFHYTSLRGVSRLSEHFDNVVRLGGSGSCNEETAVRIHCDSPRWEALAILGVDGALITHLAAQYEPCSLEA